MKRQKMLITLAGLVAVVATSATIAAFTLTGDGSGTPAQESLGTQEPAFEDDKLPTFDPAPDTIDDGKGGVSVINPDVKVDDTPPLHGDPAPPVGRPLPQPVDGTDVPGTEPVIEPIAPGVVGPTDNSKDPGVPAGLSPLSPTDDVEEVGTEVVRVELALADLQDNLLASGAEVKVSGEVESEGIFSVDGRVLEVNGERVLVMDYVDATALEAEAAGISLNGSSVATHGKVSMILWVAPPHFFRTETAIVLYVGESPSVIEALTSVLGPQFAGR